MIECQFEKKYKTKKLRHIGVVAIVEEKGKLLLVKRASFLDTEPGKLDFPGGFLDRNETTKEGVLRELKEETGYLGKVIDLFRVIDYPYRVGDLERQNVDFVYLIKNLKKVCEHDKESEEVLWLSLRKLFNYQKEFAFDRFSLVVKPYLEYKKTRLKPQLVF